MDNAEPVLAAILLGLLGDGESASVLIEGLHEAYTMGWEWYTDKAATIMAVVGPQAMPHILAELQRIEQAPDRDPYPPHYYWTLTASLGTICQLHPEAIADIIEPVREHINDRRFDREYAEHLPSLDTFAERMEHLQQMPTRTELWVDASLDIRAPELTPAIEDFFERHGPGYRSTIYGTRDDYWKWYEENHRTQPSREDLIDTYKELHKRTTEPEPDEPDVRPAEHKALADYGFYRDDDLYAPTQPYIRSELKIGRNDPCPCGSGKKYKKCHGK